MVITARAERYPSAWELVMQHRTAGYHRILVVNASKSGLRFRGGPRCAIGDRIRFKIVDRLVTGRIVRSSALGGAMAFDAPLTDLQLTTLRQYRSYG